ncbi:MAG: polysaccharide deacetylase family protein [Firmicutes bacterium]|nr:polysaccharide deacetylase family protein [Bacillota bacterium]MBE3590873.1 polysaccharide deacetylase family protein [Bacillota bacterium]
MMKRSSRTRTRRFLQALGAAALAASLAAEAWLVAARLGGGGSSGAVGGGTSGAGGAPGVSETAAPAGLTAAAQPGGASEASTEPVPVLMYHELGDPSGAWSELYVRPDDFRRQMDYLKSHGYETITLAEAVDAWAGRRPMPKKPVVVTFDDGYASTYTVALPILRANHQVATLFLEAGILNRPHGLTDAMVQAWLAAGDELGSHTMTHPDLRRVPAKRLTEEVAGSRTYLAQRFKTVVRTFAYPSGRYDERVVKAVEEAGYEAAVTTEPGLARPDERWTLHRIRINRSDGLKGFIQKLEAAR